MRTAMLRRLSQSKVTIRRHKLTFPTTWAYSTGKSDSHNLKMSGISVNGSWHNNAMPRKLTDSSGRQTKTFQRRFNRSILTKARHIHQHQHISSITAARAQSECARRSAQKNFLRRDNFRDSNERKPQEECVEILLFDRFYYLKVITQRWQDAVQARRTSERKQRA